MELVQGTRKSPKFASEEDFISSMPEIVMTNIMDRLPIRDAVRTSILSTNWRFKWTFLSQLVFDEKFFKNLVGTGGTDNYDWRNVIEFLLQLEGAITKFVLHLPHHMIFDVKDINHWFLFLSRKGIMDVTVLNWHKTPIKLPFHFFSCLELNYLELQNCCFDPPPSFCCFPYLLRLDLKFVKFESYKCGELITRCPLLKVLRIAFCVLSGKVKLAELAKLKNLRFLSLSLSTLDITPFTTSSIFQFFGYFPKLQVLHLDFQMCKLLAEAGARNGVPTSFPYFKTLHLCSIDFGDDVIVSYVLETIYCSPNLQTLRILGSVHNDVPPTALSSSDLCRKTIRPLQLQSIVFSHFGGSENEVCLKKFLLASSPLLKKMRIGLNSSLRVGRDSIKFNLGKSC